MTAFRRIAHGVAGVLALALLGVAAGCGSDSSRSDSRSDRAATASTATRTPEPTPSPAPTPVPVNVSYSGPFVTKSDQVTLRGRVSPKGATVKVNGRAASVHGRRWTLATTLTHKGDTKWHVTAFKPGHGRDKTSGIVTRKLTAVERAAAEAAKREAFIASATTIPYNQLEKNADRYRGVRVAYHGQIFQIQEQYGQTWMLLSVTDEGYGIWDDNIWINYNGTIQGAEDDIITVYGVIKGSKSYETQIGGETYVPKMRAEYIVE